ncbi:MAG: hypothetical protein V3T05_13940 [Myxococcota bacterium]
MRRLDDKTLARGDRRLVFEHEWRDDFVGEALTLEVDASSQLRTIEFYSSKLGVVRWTAGTGLGVARHWESEDEAGRGLAGPRAALLDGASPDVQSLLIIDTVLAHFRGTELLGIVRAALKQPQLPRIIEAEHVDLFADESIVELDDPATGIGTRVKRAMLDLLGN